MLISFARPVSTFAQVTCPVGTPPGQIGQNPTCSGCAPGLIVGAASKCMTPAQLQTSQWTIPVMQQIDKGRDDQEANNPNLRGTGFDILSTVVGGLGQIVLTGSDKKGTLTGDSGVTSAAKMIGMLYVPPATSQEYIADVLKDAGVATPAYAQGLGFSALAPVLETWKIFRTVAYFFYVVIFLIIGFMIMFRQKIGSQTVVTVQQALPKLLISLIAVTFSYAIAGFMIEVMYLAMSFIVNVFASGTLGAEKINGQTIQQFGSNSNIFNIAGIIISGGFQNTVSNSVGNMVNGVLGIQPDQAGAILGSITGLAAVVVFAIALLFSLFRLFFELLKTYITLIIMIVTAPVALMLGALPGNNAFSSWLKGLFFNLAVFPTVLLTIVMAFLLQTSISNNGGFLPPYIGGVGTAGSVAPLLGLGVLLVIPDIVTKVKKMAPAGPFDEFANKAAAAVKQGWKGGELVPGLGFTDTRKLPLGGLSGQNVVTKPFTSGYGLAKDLTGKVAAGGVGNVLPFTRRVTPPQKTTIDENKNMPDPSRRNRV